MIIQTYLIFFGLMAILFFGVSLLVKKQFYKFVIPINLVFLCLVYAFGATILGLPKPMQYNLPFFNYETISANNIFQVVAGWIDERQGLVYLLIKEGSDARLKTFAATPEFLGELNQAVATAGGFTFALSVETNYDGGTGAHVKMGQFQRNMTTSKIIHNEDNQEGILQERKID